MPPLRALVADDSTDQLLPVCRLQGARAKGVGLLLCILEGGKGGGHAALRLYSETRRINRVGLDAARETYLMSQSSVVDTVD